MPPVSEEPSTGGRPRFALPVGWWRKRPHLSWLPGLTRQPWLLSLATAGWAALIGLVLAATPMLIIWLGSTEESAGWAASLRLGGLLWLVANGAAVSIGGITITLLPWGLTLIPLVLLGFGGAWATRRSRVAEPLRLLWIVLPGSVLYALIAAGVDVLVSEPAARADLLDSTLGALVVALVALTWGAARAFGLLRMEWVPSVVRVGLRAGATAFLIVIGLGAVVAAISLLVSIDDAVTMGRSLGAGIGGGLGLLLLGIAYVPVMVVWGTSYLLGAGLSLGSGSVLSPFLPSGAPTDLPPFPLLAALPQQPPPMAWLLPLSAVVAGAMAGALIGRDSRREARLVRLAMAASTAVLAGVLLAAVAWLSSGSLGASALTGLGPDPVILGVLGAVLVVLGAIPTAVAPRPPARPSLAVAATVLVDDDSDVAPAAPVSGFPREDLEAVDVALEPGAFADVTEVDVDLVFPPRPADEGTETADE